jgi:hypothetical protein
MCLLLVGCSLLWDCAVNSLRALEPNGRNAAAWSCHAEDRPRSRGSHKVIWDLRRHNDKNELLEMLEEKNG